MTEDTLKDEISQKRILPHDSTKPRNYTLTIFSSQADKLFVFQTANLPQMDNITYPFIWNP